MSIYDRPFDPDQSAASRSGCVCGRHRSPAEHDYAQAHDAMRAGRAEQAEEKRYEGVVASAVMRKIFPEGRRAPRVPEKRRRLDRARGALAVLPAQDRDRSVRARRAAREEGPQGRLHPDHLRDADHHGAPDGLLYQARAERRGDQDRGLGGDPRQDAEQGIRRRAHALADAARDHARRRLEPDALHGAGDREHQRAGDHARRSSTRTSAIRSPGRASSSRCRSTTRCTTTCCATTSPSTGLDPDQDVQIRAVPPPEMVANLRADNIDGFLAPDPMNQRAVYRRRRLHPRAVEGDLGRPSVLRLRGLAGVRHGVAEHLCGAAEGDHRRDRVRHARPRTASRSPRRSRRRTTSTSR